MSFSVGILYSAQEFVSFIHETPVAAEEFRRHFKRFSVARPEDILEVVVKCNWADIHMDGHCRITAKGKNLLGGAPEKVLRIQLYDVIDAEQPPWANKLQNGRNEAIRFFPDDVAQCFKEAGLLGSWSEEIINWWDRLAMAMRSRKLLINLNTGRLAESCSVKYETERTGVCPHWQSLESNFSGYDILSMVSKDDPSQRMIEVKGSTLKKKEAFCFITRNEWETAKLSKDYHFHLWCLAGPPFLIDVDKATVEQHIPVDNGEGVWETTKLYFRDF
jgi:Domain of unknown function (DUF3883)